MVDVLRCPICNNTDFEPTLQAKDYTVTSETFTIQSCSQCGLLITSPRPYAEELEKYYKSDNYISHSSKATNITDRLFIVARKFTLTQKLSLVSKYSSKGKLLDYGCGTGDFLLAASKKNWQVFGVEPSSSVTKKSTTLQIVSSLDQVSTNQFDAITLWHVLEHIPNINEIICQLRERISKGGTIFIAVPNYKSFDGAYYRELWAGYDVPRHLWHFNRETMSKLIKKNSLKVIKIKPMFLDSIYVSQLSEKYKANDKSSMLTMIKGSIIGLRSNLSAASTGEYSSLIYIVKK